MAKFKALAAGLIALGALAATPAAADGLRFGFYGPNGGVVIDTHGSRSYGYYGAPARYGYYGLRPHQVRRILRRRGFHAIDVAGRRGPVYVARATNRRGHRVRVLVSARTGRIVDVDVIRYAKRRHDGRRGPGRRHR